MTGEPIAGNPMADEMRDLYEVANQLAGYVGPDTPEQLAGFLLRESNEAAKLADEIVHLRARISRPSITADAVAYTGSGSLAAMKYGGEGYIYPEKDDAHPIALFSHPAPAGAGDTEPGDLVERLLTNARYLRKMIVNTSFGGDGLAITLKQPSTLLEDLDDAASALSSLRAERDDLREELKRAEERHLVGLRLAFNDSPAESSLAAEKQRAKDLESVIAVRSANEIDALHAFEQRVAALEGALRETLEIASRNEAGAYQDRARAALSEV